MNDSSHAERFQLGQVTSYKVCYVAFNTIQVPCYADNDSDWQYEQTWYALESTTKETCCGSLAITTLHILRRMLYVYCELKMN